MSAAYPFRLNLVSGKWGEVHFGEPVYNGILVLQSQQSGLRASRWADMRNKLREHMRKLIILIIGIIFLSSCISTEDNNIVIQNTNIPVITSITNLEKNENTVKVATPNPTDDGKYYLGDFIDWNGYFAAAQEIEDPVAPNEWYWPDEGERIVSVFIVIGNQKGEQLYFSFVNMSLRDNSGNLYMATYAGHENEIVSAYIDCGERLQGWLDFVIPADALTEALVYTYENEKKVSISLLSPPADREPRTVDASRNPRMDSTLGENTIGNGFSLSALKIEEPTEPAWPEWFEPLPNTHLVGVEFDLRNISGEQRNFYNYGFKLVDSNGFLYEIELNAKYLPESGVISRGESLRGWVTFLIPDRTLLESLKYFSPEMNEPLWAGLRS
jgi:hypothetical protein